MKRQTGFTLIELMVIIAVIGILAGFGVPQLNRMIENNRVITALNSLSAHLAYARNEAVTSSRSVSIQPLTGNNWAQGWQVFADGNGDGALNPDEEILRIVDDMNLPGTTIISNGNPDAVTYNRIGNVTQGVIFTLNSSNYTNKELTVSVTGNVKLN